MTLPLWLVGCTKNNEALSTSSVAQLAMQPLTWPDTTALRQPDDHQVRLVEYNLADLFERSMDTNKFGDLGVHDGTLLIDNGCLILKEDFSDFKSALVFPKNTASIHHGLLKLNIQGRDSQYKIGSSYRLSSIKGKVNDDRVHLPAECHVDAILFVD